MTGWDDISKLHEQLQSAPVTGDPQLCRLLPLHGSMPTANQQAIFARPPKGVRKVPLCLPLRLEAPGLGRLYIIHHATTVESMSPSDFPVRSQVVLTTNIAETSITIDDIVYVVNGCKVSRAPARPWLLPGSSGAF
jgi:ATP-dependent RNA helicase DHX36